MTHRFIKAEVKHRRAASSQMRQKLSDVLTARFAAGVPAHTEETRKARALRSTRRKQRAAKPFTALDKQHIVAWYMAGRSMCFIARKMGTGERPNMPGHPRLSRIRTVLLRCKVLTPTTRQVRRKAA